MNRLIAGNLVTLVSSIGIVLIDFIKSKEKTLFYQTIDYGIMAIGNSILGGIAGLITNIISIIRNIVCIKYDFNWILKIVFILAQGIFILIFNVEGIFGFLPFVTVTIYVLYLDAKDIRKFKASIPISEIFWVVYDLSILNISAAIFDTLTLVSNSYSLYQIVKENKQLNSVTVFTL